MKLKDKLRHWLFKEELEDIAKIKELIETQYAESLQQLNHGCMKLREATDMHDKSYALLQDCRKWMNSICDVGTDLGFKSSDHSWAVICIHGKMDYVKFVNMSQRDLRSVIDFLKNFEYSNRVTDSPLYHKQMIEDMIVEL